MAWCDSSRSSYWTMVNQTIEVCGLMGKLFGDFAAQQLQTVGEAESRAGEDDFGAELGGDFEVVAGETQLLKQPRQGAFFGALGGDVGDGVQADVVVAAAEPVERVQPADRGVAFENANALVEIGQANARRQARHACTDDDRVVHGRSWGLGGARRGLFLNPSSNSRLAPNNP